MAKKSVRQSTGRPPDELMLGLTQLSMRQLASTLEDSVLEPRASKEKLLASARPSATQRVHEAPALVDVAAPVGGAAVGLKVKPGSKAVPKHSATRHGWSDLLGEISESSRRVRVARGGRIGSASARGGLPSLGAAPGEFDPPPLSRASPRPGLAPASSLGGEAAAVGAGGATSSSAAPSPRPQPPSVAPSPRPPPTLAVPSPRPPQPPAAVVVGTGGASSSSRAPTPRRPQPPVASTQGRSGRGSPRGDPGSPDVAAVVARHGLAAFASEEDEAIWQSYKIDEEKVPDSTLALFWRRALDRKYCEEEIAPLPRVPRLTVTKREVEQLPVVHDIEHWRQVNKRRREQRKLREESEQFPSLNNMLHTLFGEQSPPKMRMMQLKNTIQNLIMTKKSHNSMSRWVSRGSAHASDEVNETELQAEVNAQLRADAIEDAKSPPPKGFQGVHHKGRRNAIDLGQPTGQVMSIVDEPAKRGRRQDARLLQGLEALRAASGTGEMDKALDKVKDVSVKCQERCQRKVDRMHDRFLQKKGQLSSRLQRRVQRLQLDFQEIHDKKVNLILPGSIASESPLGAAQEGTGPRPSVLTYLKRQRHFVERDRQGRHARYLQQVDRFQSHLRLLADPNRVPERGEVYLSECFRHVLSAGLVVDNAYFFRALGNLEGEDFEKPPTVNLLAACCDAFDIDLRRYWAFLELKELPKRSLRPCPEQVCSWQDGAPWCGVALEDAKDVIDQLEQLAILDEESGDEVPECARDPLPFGPIMPEEIPTSSELVSRDDPLREILDAVALDSVLERYNLCRAENLREAGFHRSSFVGSEEGSEASPESSAAAATSTEAVSPESSRSARAAAFEPRPPPLGPGATASEARRAFTTRARRPPLRGYPTLRSTRNFDGLSNAATTGGSQERPPRSPRSPSPRPKPTPPPPQQPALRPVPERPGLPLEHDVLE